MEDGEEADRGFLTAAMHPHATRWAARTGGLVPMLKSLEESWPHLFAVPAGRLREAARPWVPKDDSEREVEKAYKRATYFVHPDRLSGAKRDLSVCVEAEEVLKLLTTAHGDKSGWFSSGDSARVPPSVSAASASDPKSECPPSAGAAAGTANGTRVGDVETPRGSNANNVRDAVFGQKVEQPGSAGARNPD
eukprot:CAMPEP_0183355120 /NCGR_PEP_ID=MMETSP0164_2-20130417/39228_1 /TAXON_ID=221442 /ORGANISM="Coccolithus pelagicus ssp braarudi, Strain PLY182g" /LENGTH=191 /DNA_ID=CAMNT_0025528141 /DNA_START=138 /DNA_END=710 /DNA_ORIENTATION=+